MELQHYETISNTSKYKLIKKESINAIHRGIINIMKDSKSNCTPILTIKEYLN